MSLKKRKEIQSQAIEAVRKANHKATILAAGGFGKSWIMHRFFLDCEEKGLFNHVLYSYTEAQGENMAKEFEKYNSIYEPLKGTVTYLCYASMVRDDSFTSVGCDEYDVALSAKFSKILKFYKDSGKPMLCTSATLTREGNPYIKSSTGVTFRQGEKDMKEGNITENISKAQLFEMVCYPIVFTYGYEQGVKDGILSPIETHIIHHLPDSRNLDIVITKNGYNGKPWMGSEHQWLEWHVARSKEFYKNKYWAIQLNKTIIPRFIRNLPSKVDRVKNYLKTLEGQVLIFGVELSLINQITPNVLTSKSSTNFTIRKSGYWYFTRDSKKRYFKQNLKSLLKTHIDKEVYDKAKEFWLNQRLDEKELMSLFNNGDINILGSSKKIGRGVTMERVDHIVFVSYHGKYAEVSQKWYRGVRIDERENKVCKLHFLVTHVPSSPGRFEEKWFKELQLVKDDKGNVIEKINLNVV